jgi:hypothetical protein
MSTFGRDNDEIWSRGIVRSSTVIALDEWRPSRPKLLISSDEFVTGFVPPDYLIEGILLKRFLYSFTGLTGAGKTAIALRIAAHVASGKTLAGRDIDPGRVVYLAGENPTDVRMRWIAMLEKMGLDGSPVHFVEGKISISESLEDLKREVRDVGGADLVIVDTSPAYYEGSEENDNVQMLEHAHKLRGLVSLPGGPCVLAACHPVKGASNENLLPRGGGSFLNEMDGNLVVKKRDSVAELHWQGKLRAPDFEPITFQLETVYSDILIDSKGRDIPTVMAGAISDEAATTLEAKARRDEDAVLTLMAQTPGGSIASMAQALGWLTSNGEPYKSRVQRALKSLKDEKYVFLQRGSYVLTEKGKDEAKRCS